MADKDNLVHVEIFGQAYAVRGGENPGYVEKLAAYVDEQMKEVSRTSGAVDSLRMTYLKKTANNTPNRIDNRWRSGITALDSLRMSY